MTTNEPRTFREKPVEIEAMRYEGTTESANHILSWIGRLGGAAERKNRVKPEAGLVITTAEGLMLASPGDYVIREPFPTDDRKFYPCKPDIFEVTYTAASAEDEKTGPVSIVFETWEQLCTYAESGHFNGLALLREADGRAWLYFEGEDGPMCLRPWDDDEEALTRAKAGALVVACFSEPDDFAYPVTVTVDYYAPEVPGV